MLHRDMKEGAIKLVPENADDLWHLGRVIEPGDRISAMTPRLVTIERGDGAEKVGKRQMFIVLKAEKIELHKTTGRLRITGPIISGPEETQRGAYHTIEAEQGKSITIQKEWKRFQMDILERAKTKVPSVLVVVVDYGDAEIHMLRESGLEEKGRLSAQISKMDESAKPKFYSDLVAAIAKDGKAAERIIIAGPGFAKEELLKRLAAADAALARKAMLETVSSVAGGAGEVLRRGAVRRVLQQSRLAEETEAVSAFLAELARDGSVAYGMDEVEKAAVFGAVELLLVSEEKVRDDDVSGLLAEVERKRGRVMVVSACHEAGKQLLHLGGVAAMLRFRIS